MGLFETDVKVYDMVLLQMIPIIISFLLIGAHFLRGSNFFLVALSLILPFLLLVRSSWAVRTIQFALVIAACEWIRTGVAIYSTRIAAGEPYVRMIIIFVFVVLFTLASCCAFYLPSLNRRFGLKRHERK